jgi:proline dehydrogenase
MSTATSIASSVWRPLAQRAARRYIAGGLPTDAAAVCADYRDRGLGSTVGFWNRSDESPDDVTARCLEALEAVSFPAAKVSTYLSLKTPALADDAARLERLVERAHALGIHLHLDSHSHAQADAAWALLSHFAARGARLGSSLPARWARSRDDAARAMAMGLPLRIVKGHWPDPTGNGLPAEKGFLKRVEQLSGSTSLVAVATHDPVLARESLTRLLAAKTPCELEVLHGWNTGPVLRVAKELGVLSRVYVPFGNAVLPYRLSELRHEPKVVWRAFADMMRTPITG